MKAWSAALCAEVSDWPQLTQKSFFGFTALYRGPAIFGLLPRTRSVFHNNSVAFRIDGPARRIRSMIEKDPRVVAFDKNKVRWFTFELSSNADLRDALEYLTCAYEAARKRNKTT